MLLGRGCRVSAHPMPCAVPAAHPGACRGSGTFCSLMRPPSHARVLSPALRAAQTKRQIDVLLSGCISGILRSVPAMLLLSRSSLALCFPSFFLPKERGLGLQDPANPPEMLVQRGVPCPALCRDCVYPFPRASGAPQHLCPGWRLWGGLSAGPFHFPHHTLFP